MVLPVLSTPIEKTFSGEASLFQALKMVIIPLVDDIAVALLVFDEIVARCLCTKLIKSVSSHFLMKQNMSMITSMANAFRQFKVWNFRCLSEDDAPVRLRPIFCLLTDKMVPFRIIHKLIHNGIA